MENEDLALNNLCADLVSMKRWEAFPTHLLIARRTGEWVRVWDACSEAGIDTAQVKPELFATWLPDPGGNEDYAVIVFYDQESLWSMAANYNRRRLLNAVLRNVAHVESVSEIT